MIQLNPKEKVKSQIKRPLCTKVSWKVLQASRRSPKHLSTLSFCLWTSHLTSPNSPHPEMPQALWNCILAQSQSWPQPYWQTSFYYFHHISFQFLKVKHQATLWSYLNQAVSCRGNLWARLKASPWYTSFLGSKWFPSVCSKCCLLWSGWTATRAAGKAGRACPGPLSPSVTRHKFEFNPLVNAPGKTVSGLVAPQGSLSYQ